MKFDNDSFRLIGECFIHGLIYDEAVHRGSFMFKKLSWLIAKCSHFIAFGTTFLDTFARAKVGSLETRGSILVTFLLLYTTTVCKQI
jgi:hypothetical protein